MTRIYEPCKPRKDATGLELVGRAKDGRYQYRSVSVLHQGNVVNLTQEERVGLAIVRALLVAEWGTYRVYPMTRQSAHDGFGSYGRRRMWITRPQLGDIGRWFTKGEAPDANLFRTVFHEAGHNLQHGGKPHGSEFQAAEVRATVRLKARLSKGWPKLDRRSLREFKTKGERVAARKAAKKSATPEQRWREALTHAECMRSKYEAELKRAERLVAKWEKAERHARTWLGRVQG